MGIVTQSDPFEVTVISIDMRNGFSMLRGNDGKEFSLWLQTLFGGEFAPYPKEGDKLTVREQGGRIVEAYHPRYQSPKASFL